MNSPSQIKAFLFVIFLRFIISYGHETSQAVTVEILPSQSVANEIREKVISLASVDDYKNLLAYFESVENTYGTLAIDDIEPSLYNFQALTYSALFPDDTSLMVAALMKSLDHRPYDPTTWYVLGDAYNTAFNHTGALWAYEEAQKRSDNSSFIEILHAKGGGNSWKDIEYEEAKTAKEAYHCLASKTYSEICLSDYALTLQYAYVSGDTYKVFLSNIFLGDDQRVVNNNQQLVMDPVNMLNADAGAGVSKRRKIKVGFVSSNFGDSPVPVLMRGALQIINEEYKDRIQLYCFCLASKKGPHFHQTRANISSMLGDNNFVWFRNMSSFDAAKEIAMQGIEILIDLDVHSMKSRALSVLSHQPALVQLSFLGLPVSTSAKFIDYYIGDRIAIPAEHSTHFTEKLALLPNSYLVNDHAQLAGETLKMVCTKRSSASKFIGKKHATATHGATLIMATLSNWDKIDPTIFRVWANILNSFPKSILVFIDHTERDTNFQKLQSYSSIFGIPSSRLVLAEKAAHPYHLLTKTAIDVALDTFTKNGHSSGLDGMWAGVPLVTVGGGGAMPQRASESLASTLQCDFGVAYSLKAYEDSTLRLRKGALRVSSKQYDNKVKDIVAGVLVEGSEARNDAHNEVDIDDGAVVTRRFDVGRLAVWRRQAERMRAVSSLFNTSAWVQNFSQLLHAIWEVKRIQRDFHRLQPHHVFSTNR